MLINIVGHTTIELCHLFDFASSYSYLLLIAKPRQNMQSLKSAKKSHEFDDLLSMVGGFGRYTFLLYGFMCVMSLPIGLQQLVQVFYGATPKNFTCVPASSQGNNTCQTQKCCVNCRDYEFSGRLTSAVTEVSNAQLTLNN